MAGAASIVVDYIANTAGLQKASDEVTGSAGKFDKWGKTVATSVASGFAIGSVVAFGKASVSAAQESEEATSRLDAVFKSMGDSTGQASKAAQDYASELSKQTAVEDEVIMKGQAILATFANVSSASARQAGIFNRATAAAADLAAAGFGTLEGNAVQLGKALQDPVKGLTALGKSGVTFTDAQKKMIEAMVKSGDVLGAQKIVLQAIEGQVKGTAAATASEADKANLAFGEMQESIGTALLPVILALAPAMTAVANALAALGPALGPIAVGLVAAMVAMNLLNVATVAFGITLSALGVGLIIIAVAALAAGLIVLVTHWDQVTAAFSTGFAAIKSAALDVFNWIKANWPLLLGIITGPIGLAVVMVVTHWGTIKAAVIGAVEAIKGAVTTAWNAILGVVTTVGNAIKTVAVTAFDAAKTAAQGLANYISGAFTSALNAAKGVLSALGAAASALAAPFNAAADAVRGLIEAIGRIPSKISLPSLPSLPNPFSLAAPAAAMPQATAMSRGVSPAAVQRSSASAAGPIQVRVFIGNTELRGIVRSTIHDVNTGIARTLLAGGR